MLKTAFALVPFSSGIDWLLILSEYRINIDLISGMVQH